MPGMELNPYLVGVGVLAVLLCVTNLLVWWRLHATRKLVRVYERLFKDYQGDNLNQLLERLIKAEEEHDSQLNRLLEKTDIMEQRLASFVNRVAICRFKGFPDVGGDFSFSLALLSNQGDGVILTGLHGREETRLYAKPVHKFVAEYPLSREEEGVLEATKEQG